jgi:glycosyltransferase involved in cell wall biosynthesis
LTTERARRDGPTVAAASVLVAHPGATLYGSDRMVLEAVRGLVDAGVRVLLTVPAPGPLTDRVAEWGVEVAICPTPVLRRGLLSPTGLLRLLGTSAASARQARALLRRFRPDVLYVSTVTVPLWAVLGRLARIPVVCHVHEAERQSRAVLRRALAVPARMATTVIANSQFTLDVLAEATPAVRRSARVIMNGVPAPLAVEPAREVLTDPLRVLYVGRLSGRKGVLIAVEAVDELVRRGRDVHLDLVGDVFADHVEFGRELQLRIAREPLRSRVTVHGFQASVWPRLADCDVLVVPSIQPESFGNTAVEGVLAGRPVIASRIGGLPEAVAGFASARLVPPGDVEALADAVADVADSYSALAGKAADDATQAAARFAPERYRRQLAEATRELCPG